MRTQATPEYGGSALGLLRGSVGVGCLLFASLTQGSFSQACGLLLLCDWCLAQVQRPPIPHSSRALCSVGYKTLLLSESPGHQ